ncbi:MAG: hypothetical protein EOO44_15295 [Flavobacterium sp.]|nr:MAG: hypothetical protein EOO44_15295 [Flavobacterium sp.]
MITGTEIKLKTERKKKYATEEERKEAIRENKRRSKAKAKLRNNIPNPKSVNDLSKLSYRNDQFSSIKGLKFTHQCTLRFSKFTMIDDAEKKVGYFRDSLQKLKVTKNIVSYLEYGADENIHIHLAFNFKEQFLNRYNSIEKVRAYLHNIWNSNAKNGAVWVNAFQDDLHKVNYLNYILKQVFPNSCSHKRHRQIETLYVESYNDLNEIHSEMDITASSLDALPFMALSKPKNQNLLKDFIIRHKHKIVSATLTALLLFIT